MRKLVFRLLDVPKPKDRASRMIDLLLIGLIAANVFALILESVPKYSEQWKSTFQTFEAVSVSFFLIEYIGRVWTCVEYPRYASPLFGRLKYILHPLMIVDFLAILPFLVSGLSIDLRSLRMLRMFRVFRIFKLGRYGTAYRTVTEIVLEKRGELFTVLVAQTIIFVTALCLVFYFENSAQTHGFRSIPDTMWWAITTVTPLSGSGMAPVTIFGRSLAALTAILGVGVFAVPSGILAAGFMNYSKNTIDKKCPKCGKILINSQNRAT